jgi:ubiquinone/menaquinone biosynthesis C-methylase UbiE
MKRTDPDYDFTAEYSRRRSIESTETYGLRSRTAEIARILQALPDGTTILDLGTADGRMISALEERLEKRIFVGLDLDLRLLRMARKSGRDVINANIYSLCIKDKTIDIALLCATFKHLADPENALAEFRRILKPGGHLIVTDPRPGVVKIGAVLGYFERKYAQNIWSFESIVPLMAKFDFEIVEKRYFMKLRQLRFFWPIFRLVNILFGSSLGMGSQVVVLRKQS